MTLIAYNDHKAQTIPERFTEWPIVPGSDQNTKFAAISPDPSGESLLRIELTIHNRQSDRMQHYSLK